MQIQGVITGDIVDSTQIEPNMRAKLLSAIKNTVADINKYIDSEVQVEIYRGDSFQILVPNPIEALRIAFLTRLGIQYRTPLMEKNRSKNKWDARISLGIGAISFNSSSIIESDGEAYQNYHYLLEQISQKELAHKISLSPQAFSKRMTL